MSLHFLHQQLIFNDKTLLKISLLSSLSILLDNTFDFLFLNASTKIIKILVKIYDIKIIKIDLPIVFVVNLSIIIFNKYGSTTFRIFTKINKVIIVIIVFLFFFTILVN